MIQPRSEHTGLREVFLRIFFYSLVLAFLAVVFLGLWYLSVPFILSIVIYYSLHNLIDTMESYRIPRWLGILLLFFFIGSILYWILNIYIPPAVERSKPFVQYWSKELEDANGSERLREQVDDFFSIESPVVNKYLPPSKIAEKTIAIGKSSAESFLDSIPDLLTIFLITPLISFFLLLDARRIYKYFISLVPNRYFEMTLMVTNKINQQLTNYLKGVFVQSGIMAGIASVGFYFLDLNFFILFGVFLGLANMIPYLGPAIGFLPPAIYSLVVTGGIDGLLPIAIVVIICQLVDNVLVQPTVIAKSASMHPILVLLGITVGGNLFGLWGMLIAIPLMAILKVSIVILYRGLREHGII